MRLRGGLEAGLVVAASVEAAADEQQEEESVLLFARCSHWRECEGVVGTRLCWLGDAAEAYEQQKRREDIRGQRGRKWRQDYYMRNILQ